MSPAAPAEVGRIGSICLLPGSTYMSRSAGTGGFMDALIVTDKVWWYTRGEGVLRGTIIDFTTNGRRALIQLDNSPATEWVALDRLERFDEE